MIAMTFVYKRGVHLQCQRKTNYKAMRGTKILIIIMYWHSISHEMPPKLMNGVSDKVFITTAIVAYSKTFSEADVWSN